MPLHTCRYQVFDAYGHSQVDLTGLSVVPHITYTSATTLSTDVSPATHPFIHAQLNTMHSPTLML